MSFCKPTYEEHINNEKMRFKASHCKYYENKKRQPKLDHPERFFCDICQWGGTWRSRYAHTRSISHYKRLYNISSDDSRKAYTFYNNEVEKKLALKDMRHKFYNRNCEQIKEKNLAHYHKKKLENQLEPEIILSTLTDGSCSTMDGRDNIFVDSDTF